MSKYYQISPSIEEEVIGKKADGPTRVWITSEQYQDYANTYLCGGQDYYDIGGYKLEGIPQPLEGKIYRRKRPTDYMRAQPYRVSQIAVVSEKFKNVIEAVGVDKSEYKLVPISLLNRKETYYVLFVPMISKNESDIRECAFKRREYDTVSHTFKNEIVTFDTMEKYREHMISYDLAKLPLPAKYAKRDMIFSQFVTCLSISERLLKAFQEAGVYGMYVEKGLYSYDIVFKEQ